MAHSKFSKGEAVIDSRRPSRARAILPQALLLAWAPVLFLVLVSVTVLLDCLDIWVGILHGTNISVAIIALPFLFGLFCLLVNIFVAFTIKSVSLRVASLLALALIPLSIWGSRQAFPPLQERVGQRAGVRLIDSLGGPDKVRSDVLSLRDQTWARDAEIVTELTAAQQDAIPAWLRELSPDLWIDKSTHAPAVLLMFTPNRDLATSRYWLLVSDPSQYDISEIPPQRGWLKQWIIADGIILIHAW